MLFQVSTKKLIFALFKGAVGSSVVEGKRWLGNASQRNCDTIADSTMVSSFITPGMEYFIVGTRPGQSSAQILDQNSASEMCLMRYYLAD